MTCLSSSVYPNDPQSFTSTSLLIVYGVGNWNNNNRRSQRLISQFGVSKNTCARRDKSSISSKYKSFWMQIRASILHGKEENYMLLFIPTRARVFLKLRTGLFKHATNECFWTTRFLKERCDRDFCCFCFNSAKITAFCLLSCEKMLLQDQQDEFQ